MKGGSISASAKANFVTLSAVSQAILHLEKFLGHELIAHHPNQFRLTPDGQEVFRKGCELLKEAENFCNAFRPKLAFAVSATAFLAIAGDQIHHLFYNGGGLKDFVIEALWSAAKWSGIAGAVGVGILTSVGCFAMIYVYCLEKDSNTEDQ